MRYAKVDLECCNGVGWGLSLFVQGCSRHCKGCFNPDTWDYQGGKPFTQETLNTILAALQKPYTTRFSILGGEPLEPQNYRTLAEVIQEIRQTMPKIKIWLWTGKTIKELKTEQDDDLSFILQNIDVIVDGPFILERADKTLPWRGSKNQRVIYTHLDGHELS